MTKLGATPIAAPGWTAQTKEGVKIVDCDVHHNFEQPEQLLPYLSRFWQNHLLDQGLHLPSAGYANIPYRTNRPDLKDPDLKERDFNFSLEFLQREHLDPWNINYALLTGPPPFYGYTGLPDPDWAAVLCRAFNDWTIEHWLEKDDRVVNAILVSPTGSAPGRRRNQAAGRPQGYSRRDDPHGGQYAVWQPLLPSDLVKRAKSTACRSSPT